MTRDPLPDGHALEFGTPTADDYLRLRRARPAACPTRSTASPFATVTPSSHRAGHRRRRPVLPGRRHRRPARAPGEGPRQGHRGCARRSLARQGSGRRLRQPDGGWRSPPALRAIRLRTDRAALRRHGLRRQSDPEGRPLGPVSARQAPRGRQQTLVPATRPADRRPSVMTRARPRRRPAAASRR